MGFSAAELAILVKVYDESSATLDKIHGKGRNVIQMFGAMAGAIVALGSAFAGIEVIDKAIDKTAELGKNVNELTLRTGLSAEAASHMLAASDQQGIGADTLMRSLGLLAKNIKDVDDEETRAANGGMVSAAAAQQKLTDATTKANADRLKAHREYQEAIEKLHADQDRANARRVTSIVKTGTGGSVMQTLGGADEEAYGRRARDIIERYQDTLGKIDASVAKVGEAHATADPKIRSAAQAMQDFGFKQDDLLDSSGRLTEQGFARLTDAINAMPDSMTKTADIMALFGRNGAAMEPLFKLGSKGLDEAARMADKLGITLSGENVEKIHQYAVAHAKMREALAGIQIQIGLALMPLLTKFADWFVAHQPEIRAFVDRVIVKMGEAFESLRPMLSEVLDGWVKLVTFIVEHQTALEATIAVILILVVAFNPWIVMIPALIILIGVLADHWEELGGILTGVAYAVRDIVIGSFNAVIGFFQDHWKLIVALALGPVTILAYEFVKYFDEIRDAATKVIDFIVSIPSRIANFALEAADAAYNFGSGIVNSILDGIKSAPDAIRDALNSLLPDWASGAIGAIGGVIGLGGHAAGVRYVAHDEVAILHRGESVRTASETRRDGGGIGGIQIHFNGPVSLSGDDAAGAGRDVGFAVAQELRSRGFAA